MSQFNIISQTDKKCAWNARKGPALAQYVPMPLKETKCFESTQLGQGQENKIKRISEEEIVEMLMIACPNSAITKHR